MTATSTDGRGRPVEITDLLWRTDAAGDRLPIRLDEVVAALEVAGQHRAVRIVERLPRTGGLLDPVALDALLFRVHAELQRLGEELQLGERIGEALSDWARPLLADDPRMPVRVVDVGCGLGYGIRWLACHRPLGPRAELVGVDYNATLIACARELARVERLECRFVTGDAFAPGVAVADPARTIVISTGVVHHFAPAELAGFFAAQDNLGVHTFMHWDIDPSGWATLGAWLFHRSRMREPVSRHDGVLSARRAHAAPTLLTAARSGAPSYDVTCTDGPRWRPAIAGVLRPVTGTRRR